MVCLVLTDYFVISTLANEITTSYACVVAEVLVDAVKFSFVASYNKITPQRSGVTFGVVFVSVGTSL